MIKLYATSTEGGAVLANTVREVAHEAYRVLGPRNDRSHAGVVLRKIDDLRLASHQTNESSLERWLKNLRDQVEKA